MKENPLILSRRSQTAQERATRVEEAFDINSQTMEVLRRIGGVLSDTIKAWESFSSFESHMGFFRRTDTASISKHSARSLRAIKTKFQELEGNYDKIKSLKEDCSEFSSTVSLAFRLFALRLLECLTIEMQLKLRLILENKTAADQNGMTSEFTISVSFPEYRPRFMIWLMPVQVLYPPALAAAIFSMQQSAVPFELTPRAFAFALVLLFIIVHGIRFLGRRALQLWRLLREVSAWWFKNKKLDGESHESLDIELGDIGLSVTDVCSDEIMTGDNRNDPRTCGTRAILGAKGP
jgi:hypothetical protein